MKVYTDQPDREKLILAKLQKGVPLTDSEQFFARQMARSIEETESENLWSN